MMLHKLVNIQRSRFLTKKQEALAPNFEKILSKLMEKARIYLESIQWIWDTNQMEATVLSRKEVSARRHVVISSEPQTPPSCCAYSKVGDGFPCLYGVAVICEKYGSVNIHKFWKKQYEGVYFKVPPQYKIDKVIEAAKLSVVAKQNIQIQKALAPPRGRPSKDAGMRSKSCYEQGPYKKGRSLQICSLYQSPSHRANQ